MKLSVLIRNLNEAEALNLSLKALQLQKTDFEFEIVVLDNESNDNSVEVARSYGCKVYSFPRERFSYGKAINYGIENCNGAFIYLLSSHVYLLSDNFIQKIPSYFTEERIAAIRFTSTTTLENIRQALLKGERVIDWESENRDMHRVWMYGTINHSAAIRKQVWEKIKFDETVFYAEDKIWAYQVLKEGYAIKVNVPSFYMYNKTLTRDQRLNRRANEEVSYRLLTGSEAMFYSNSFKDKIKYVWREWKAFFSRVDAHFKTLRKIKKIHKNEKSRFEV